MADSSMSQASSLAARQAAFNASIKETQEVGEALSTTLIANQLDASQDKLQVEAQENSAAGILIRTKKLEKRQEFKTEKAKQAQHSVLVRKEEADGLAGQFSQERGNREYHLDPLLLSQLAGEELGAGINENSEPMEIISLIRRRMTVDGQDPDVAVVDKTFEFLLQVTSRQLNQATGVDKERLEKILKKVETAKNQHFESNSIEIQVAQKIIGAVDAVVLKTGQSVKETLDRYREVVHNPPDIQALRKFYEIKGYKSMILELKGLNSYLGGNFKRTNLDNPELAQLAGAARKMQALLGVYRQSKIHIPTMESYLHLNGVLAA
jgi:hypothetical protein